MIQTQVLSSPLMPVMIWQDWSRSLIPNVSPRCCTNGLPIGGAGDSSAGQQDTAPAPHLVNINAPGTVFDNPARQLGVKAWLTDDEKPAVAEDDEFPAEGYDVQHIILPDESETPAAQHAANPRPAAVKKHEAPAWQANEEEAARAQGFLACGQFVAPRDIANPAGSLQP